MLTLPNSLVSYGDKCLALFSGDNDPNGLYTVDLTLPTDPAGAQTVKSMMGYLTTNNSAIFVGGKITLTKGEAHEREIAYMVMLEKAVAGPAVTKVKAYALAGLRNAKEIDLEGRLTELGEYCLSDAYLATTLNWHYVGDTLPKGCFDWCFSLRRLAVSKSVKHLETASLANLTALDTLYLSPYLEELGDGVTDVFTKMGEASSEGRVKVVTRGPTYDRWDAYWKAKFPSSAVVSKGYAQAQGDYEWGYYD